MFAYNVRLGVVLFVLLICLFSSRSISAQPEVTQQPDVRTPYQQFVQRVRTDLPGDRPVCYLSKQSGSARVLPPESFLRSQLSPNGRPGAATAQFIVEYRGFTVEAQRAFQHAVDIWSTLISSPVPIRIRASWVNMEPGVLGSAGPASYRAGSDGVQKAFGYYPIALAEKIARRPLNDPSEPDIIAEFNRNNNWYFKTEGKPEREQPDMVTAVMHEIAHGLGIIGFFNVVNGVGTYSAGLPSVFDHFIRNNPGNQTPVRAISTALPDNSAALGNFLQSDNLYFDGPLTFRQFNIQRPRLAAPKVFNRAESLYHLNDEFYDQKPEHWLMRATPKLGEAVHSPGSIVMSMLADMEWKTTSVLHEPLQSSERVAELTFSVRIVSDTVVTPSSIRLFYRKSQPAPSDTATTAVPLVRVGTSDEYRFTIPASQAQGQVWYYVSAQDASGRTFTNPGRSPFGQQFFYRVQSGPDNVPPVIRYSPVKNLILNTAVADSLPIYATIADDRPTGISAASVEYQINGVAQPALPLRFAPAVIDGVRYDSLYTSRINFPANSLKPGDRITYRIVARDGSQGRNLATNPASGTYQVRVVIAQTPRDRYVNAFNNSTTTQNDFVTTGLSLTQPAGFSDPALHSAHPYGNGADFRRQTNVEATLMVPIRINANRDSSILRFDEIVLVQPGESGSRFGETAFRDYVVVEGSGDNGRSWRPLADGYNALNRPEWLTAYNYNLTDGTQFGERNSTTAGLPALYRHRAIPLLGAGGFRAGDIILIRFRLFADAVSYGWGWAIDNLGIQVPPPPIVLASEPTVDGTFTVYPNPVGADQVRIDVNLTKPVSAANLTVTNPAGQVLREIRLKSNGTKIRELVDLSELPAGLYVLRLNLGDVMLSRRIFITH